jgi:hypothetical protein
MLKKTLNDDQSADISAELVTVAQCNSADAADIICSDLESVGIDAWANTEPAATTVGDLKKVVIADLLGGPVAGALAASGIPSKVTYINVRAEDALRAQSLVVARDPNEEMETVATYQTIVEADLIREELNSAGIPAWVGNAMVAQTFITMPETGITVEVRASDLDRARSAIANIGSAQPITDEEMDAAVDASIAENNPNV